MNTDLLKKAEQYVEDHFSGKIDPAYTYHNIDHTREVCYAIESLSKESGVSDEDREILLLAGWFHDTGFENGPVNHESRSARIAEEFLKRENYPEEKIARVSSLIMATYPEKKPEGELEAIIKDADLSGLGSINYLKESERLRQEWSNLQELKMSDREWYNMNYEFISNHKYQSKAGKKMFKKPKKTNKKLLKGKLKELKTAGNTISGNKSAQTQFKTALRNHIDLSAIADNKANIMLSVNALIITVAMPFIAAQVIDNPLLIFPSVILLAVCVVAMIYATLATRPIKMKGVVTPEEVDQRSSNLFFFGNFFQMKFDDYETGIKSVVSDEDLLDNSITRDLFYLGKSLGMKYTYLRKCYNVFMYGMVVAVIAFVIALVITEIQS